MARLSWESRRQHFIDATIHVVATEGVARAGIRRIAEAAKAPMAGLHYCFETKEELFQAVFDVCAAAGVESIGRGVTPGMGLHHAIEVIFRNGAEWVLENRDMQQAQFELVHWALRSPGYSHLAHHAYQTYIDAGVKLLREARQEHEMGVNLEMLAQQMVALTDGHALQFLSLDNRAPGVAIDYAVRILQAAIVIDVPESAKVQVKAKSRT